MRRLALLVLLPLVLASPAQLGRAGGATPSGLFVFSNDRDGDSDIYTVRADGTGLRALTRTTKREDVAAVAASGRTIVFWQYTLEYHAPPPVLYAIRDDGTRLAWLPTGERPAVSPDGSTIAYEGPPGGLWLVQSDGTRLRRLTRGARDWEATWSPDGHRLAFVRRQAHGDELVLIDVATRHEHVIVRRRQLWDPSWSPTGREIAFHDGGGLRRADVGSGTTHLVAPDVLEFAWSPDGRRLAFTTRLNLNRYCETSGFCEGLNTLYISRRDGTGRQRLTDYASYPVFSPEGRSIAFLRNSGPTNADLWTIGVDGLHQRQVTHRGTVDRGFAWVASLPARGRPVPEPPPHERLVGGELQSVAPVIGVAASGSRVAVAVASAHSECRHVLLWPRPGRLVRLGTPAPCTPGFTSSSGRLTLAGERAAWTETIAPFEEYDYVQTATVESPRPLTVAEGVVPDNAYYDLAIFHDRDEILVKDTYEIYALTPRGAPCQQTTVRLCAHVATIHGDLLDVHDGDFLIRGSEYTLIRADGTVLAQPSLSLRADCQSPRLTSRWIVTVCNGQWFEVFDRLSGTLVQSRSMGSLDVRIQDVDDSFAVASAGSQLWVIRLADLWAGRVAIPPQKIPPHAAFSAAGLVVSTYVPGARYPGRVRQIRLPALEHP